MKADLEREISGNANTWSVGNWGFTGTANNPWLYVGANGYTTTSTPTGKLVTGSASDPVFKQTISGSSIKQYDSWRVNYGFGNFGFISPAYADGSPTSAGRAGWTYYYPNYAKLTMVMSVKADNPVTIDFSGRAVSNVAIVSNSMVVLAGNINNPEGTTTIAAIGGVTANADGSIDTHNLSVTTTAGIGSPARPIPVTIMEDENELGTLSASAGSEGIYLTLDSGAVLGTVSAVTSGTSYGDVSISARDSLTRSATQPVTATNVRGRNITLESSLGAVGSDAHPIVIDSSYDNRFSRAGVVTVIASGAVGIDERTGDLWVGSITSAAGDVFVTVRDGNVFDAAAQTSASVLSPEEIQAIWSRLSLTDASDRNARTVEAFQTQVNARYAEYWRLLLSGSVNNGVYTLSDDDVAFYRPRTATALDISAPTDEQVKAYADWLYRSLVAFFDNVVLPADVSLGLAEVTAPLRGLGPILGFNWRWSGPFTTYDPGFAYNPSDEQSDALTANSQWTDAQLLNSLKRTPFVGGGTATISGRDVTLHVSKNVGRYVPSIDISANAFFDGTLTDVQAAAIAVASSSDVTYYGLTSTGSTAPFQFTSDGQYPPGIIELAFLRITQVSPVFIGANGLIKATATTGSALLQNVVGDMKVKSVTAAGEVRLIAPGSIIASGAGPHVTTTTANGNLVVTAGTGSIGTEAAPFVLDIGGVITSATAGGSIHMTKYSGDLSFKSITADETVSLCAPFGSILQAAGGSGIAADDVVLAAVGSIGTWTSFIDVDATSAEAVSDGGSVFLRSANALDLSLVDAEFGDVVLDIGGTAGVGRIAVPRGLLSFFANGAILDRRDEDVTPQPDSLVNIVADRAVLRALNGIGGEANWLETTFNRLETRSFADMWIKNYGDMTVGGVSSDFAGLQGAGKLHLTLASTLTLDEAIDSGGAEIIVTASEGLALNAAVRSGGGSITFHAGTFISLSPIAGIDAKSGAPLVSLQADGGAITMASGSTINGADGRVELDATGDVSVTSITSTGEVSVKSRNGRINNALPDLDQINIASERLYLFAAQDIGAVAYPLTT
ncbi:MAG: hypothetical protein ACO3Z6_15580, partial [Pseudomonadales bacterium]